MDPLSLTASIAAVVGVAHTAAKHLEQLRSALRQASSSISALVNEVSDLQIVLEACQTAADELESISQSSANLRLVLQKTRTDLGELDAVVSSCVLPPASDGPLTRQIAKLKWVHEKGRTEALRNRLRVSKQNIMMLLESHSLSTISRVQVAVDRISFAKENHSVESFEKLDEAVQKLSLQLVRSESMISSNEKLHEKLERLCRSSPETPISWPSTTSSEFESFVGQDSVADSALGNGGTLRVLASCYKKTCQPWCSCRCHIRHNIRTPSHMKGFLGSLFMGYSGIPMMTPSCNERRCRKRSGTRILLSYQFPEWFCMRTLCGSLMNDKTMGPEMLLRIEATIPYASQTYQHCLNGNVGALQHLFEEGLASSYDRDPEGFSLLHNALKFEQYGICHLLISSGSDLYKEDHTGLSPFHYAWDAILLHPKKTNTKKALLGLFPQEEGGLDERQFSRIHKCVLGLVGSSLGNELTISTSTIDEPDDIGRTPLFWAAYRGDFNSVKLLLHFGAKLTTAPTRGRENTPLHAAAISGNEKVVQELLRYGAPVDSLGRDNITPLSLAASVNDGNECLTLLIEYGADVNAEDVEGRAPLLIAAQNGMLENAQELLKNGADINKTAEDGWTALASCVFWNMCDSVLLLIQHGADPRITTDEGDTFLHTTARYADLCMIETLTNFPFLYLDGDVPNSAGMIAQDVANQRHDEGPEWKQAFSNLIDIAKSRSRAETEQKPSRELGNEVLVEVGQNETEIEKGTVIDFEVTEDDDDELEIFEDALEYIID